MKKTELKQILRPLIKECIKEVVFEEGFLSGIISEVVKGVSTSNTLMVESKKQDEELERLAYEKEKRTNANEKLNEYKQKMLEAINGDAYNGVNIFEGTTPLTNGGDPSSKAGGYGPLTGKAPSDAGVDISGLMNKTSTWKALIGK